MNSVSKMTSYIENIVTHPTTKLARLLKSEVDLRRVDIKIVAKSVYDYRTRLDDLVDGYRPQMKNNKASTHIQLNI